MKRFYEDEGIIGITVKNLIEELKKFPPTAHVYVEGCDCIGAGVCVSALNVDDVLIERAK
jgi:hypothetical protein